MTTTHKRKPVTFDEYWLTSKAWERRGLPLRVARALVNNGFLTPDDVQRAHDLELSTIPGVGKRSLALLYELVGRDRPGRRPAGRPKRRTASTPIQRID